MEIFLFILMVIGAATCLLALDYFRKPPTQRKSFFQLDVEADSRKRETVRKMHEYKQSQRR